MSDYIPARDSDALVWFQNFRDNISASPATFGLTAADAASITTVVTDFESKLAIASNEATRTKQTIADKDDARMTAEALCRNYAMEIKFNEGVSDGDKLIVGVRPVNTNRDPIEVPQSSPLISILGATQGSQTLRYADWTTPDSPAKPFGATELQLFIAITDEGNAAIEQAQFYGKFTRNPIAVAFDAEDDGKVATYWGRWASARGDVGPWSVPESMRIAA